MRTAGKTPVAAVATPLPRRPATNEERHYIMRDGIQARMKPDKSCNDTAARLCQLHMEAGNSLLATASTHRGQRYSSQGWTCARSGECWLLLLLLLLALVVARRGLPLFRCLYRAREVSATTQKKISSKERLSHAELCGDTWVTSLYHCF